MNAFGGYDVEDLRAGMNASFSKTISAADIDMFAQATGDDNALHMDDGYASATLFGGRIAHGMLTAGVVSAALAKRIPGPGFIYLGQRLDFVAPVYPGDSVIATVTIESVDPTSSRVVLSTVCRVNDSVVLQGEATLKASTINPANRHHD